MRRCVPVLTLQPAGFIGLINILTRVFFFSPVLENESLEMEKAEKPCPGALHLPCLWLGAHRVHKCFPVSEGQTASWRRE